MSYILWRTLQAQALSVTVDSLVVQRLCSLALCIANRAAMPMSYILWRTTQAQVSQPSPSYIVLRFLPAQSYTYYAGVCRLSLFLYDYVSSGSGYRSRIIASADEYVVWHYVSQIELRSLCPTYYVGTTYYQQDSVSTGYHSRFIAGANDYVASGARYCNTLQHATTHCNTLQHATTHCNTLQHAATHCNTLQHTATHCNTLQHTATRCNTLQHAATHCNTMQRLALDIADRAARAYSVPCRVTWCHIHLRYLAPRTSIHNCERLHSVTQSHVAPHRSTIREATQCCIVHVDLRHWLVPHRHRRCAYICVCRINLRYLDTKCPIMRDRSCCSVLQRVAVCCSMLQCVAVCMRDRCTHGCTAAWHSVLPQPTWCHIDIIQLSPRMYAQLREPTQCHILPHTPAIPMGWLRSVGSIRLWSLLQNIVSFIGLFCKRDL